MRRRWMLPPLSLLVVLPVLAACHGAAVAVGAVAVVDGVTIAVLGHDIVDSVYSVASGRDCSIVRLDQGKTYCRPAELPPPPPEFCTKSLGDVDCWANPDALNSRSRPLADGPRALTAEQERNASQSWLERWF